MKIFKKTRSKKQFIINKTTEIDVFAYSEACLTDSLDDLTKKVDYIWELFTKFNNHRFVPHKYRPIQTLVPRDQKSIF